MGEHHVSLSILNSRLRKTGNCRGVEQTKTIQKLFPVSLKLGQREISYFHRGDTVFKGCSFPSHTEIDSARAL